MNWQSFGSGDNKSSRQTQRAIRLLLEALEDRQVPALLLDAGSQNLQDDPTLLQYPGMATPFTKDRIIVQLEGNAGLDYLKGYIQGKPGTELNKAVDFSNSSVIWQTNENTMLRVKLTKDVDPVGAYYALKDIPKVEFASLNFSYRHKDGYGKDDYTPNDPFAGPSYSQQYHHQMIEDYKAWESIRGTGPTFVGANGNVNGPIVAVTDDGFDTTNPDLAKVMWVNSGEIPGNGLDDDGNGYVDDVNGVNVAKALPGQADEPDGFIQPSDPSLDQHGTHTSGLIGAQMDNQTLISGVAGGGLIQSDGSTAGTGGARIMGIKWDSSYLSGYDSDVIITGLNYAYKMGADIVSSSYQLITRPGGFLFSDDLGVINAFKKLHDKGVICFVSAGNSDLDVNVAYSKLPYAVVVTSTDEFQQKSSFSNYGLASDLAAPGSNILSLAPMPLGLQFLSGTSMATPIVAGVAALIKSAHPDWTRDQIVSQLYATVNNIDNLNPSYVGELGHGRVNAFGGVTSSSGFVAIANGQTITAGADLDGSVKIWDSTGRLQQNIAVAPGVALTSISMDGDLKMVVGAADGSVYYLTRLSSQGSVWFKVTGKYNTGSPVVSVEIGKQGLSGTAFAVNTKGEAIQYNFSTKTATTLNVGGAASSLKMNPGQSRLVIALKAGGFKVFDPSSLALISAWDQPTRVTAMDFDKTTGTTLFAGLETGAVLKFDLSSTNPVATGSTFSSDASTPVLALSAGTGNTMTYGFGDGRVFVRNVTSGSFLNQISLPRDPVLDGSGKPVKDANGVPLTETISSLLVFPGGSEFAVATMSREVYRFGAKKAVGINFGASKVTAVAESKTAGTFGFATALSDGTIQFLSGNSVIGSITTLSGAPITQLKWSADGSTLAVVDSTGTATLLYFPGTPSFRQVTLSSPLVTSPIKQIAFSQDGLSLATASEDGSIFEWDLAAATKTVKFAFTIPSGATYPATSPGSVNGLAYTPDGRFLATADNAGFSRLWNRDPLESKNKDSNGNFAPTYLGALGTAASNMPALTAIATSPNSNFIGLGNQNGQVDVYDLTKLKLIAKSIGATQPVVSLGFTGNSQSILVGTGDGLVRLIQAGSGVLVSTVRDSDSQLVGLSLDNSSVFSTNLDFLAGFADGTVERFQTPVVNKSNSYLGQGAVPTIGAVSNLPGNGVTTNVVPKDIEITFSGLFDLAKFQSKGAVRLVGRGPDGIFDTADDNIVVMSPTKSLAIGTNSAIFRVVGVLPPDVYQFRVSASAATNPFGEKLDGNGDGVPGDDYIGPVFEYTGGGGTIYGRVTGGNQQFTSDLTGVAGRRVYVDLNGNGVFDQVYSPGSEGPTKTANATQVPRAIDNSAPTTAILNVTNTNGREGAITAVSPKLTLKHTWLGDLTGYLQAPDGSKIELFSNLPRGAGRRITGLQNIEFRNDPTLPTLSNFISNNLFSGKQILTGVVRPTGDLTVFNGLSTFGEWKLIIVDNTVADNGYLQSWSLKFQTSEPTSIQNTIDPLTGQVNYVTTTDANGYYAIPNLADGLADFTSTQLTVLLDNNSPDQAKFADFNDVFPANGIRQVTIDNQNPSLKNDYREVLAKPQATLSYKGSVLSPNLALDANSPASFTLDLTPAVIAINGVNAGSFVRGASFNTVADQVQIFADANNDGILTPKELVKTVNYPNGQSSTTITGALVNTTTPLADGKYTIYAVQVALNRYTSAPVLVGQVNLKGTAPAAPVIKAVAPLLNTIVPTTTPTLQGVSDPLTTIQLFLSGTNTVIGTGTTDANGNWSVQLTTPLAQGPSSLVAKALDFLGNQSLNSTPFALTVDSVGPAAPTITNIVGAAPNPSIPTATGVYFSKTSPTKLVVNLAQAALTTVYLDGKALFTTSQQVGPGSVSLDLPTIATNSFSSPYSLTVTQTNGFGIEGKASNPVGLVINADAPAAPAFGGVKVDSGRSDSDSITNSGNLNLFGISVPWSLIAIKIDGNLVNTVPSDNKGAWFLDYTKVSLGEGKHTVVLQAKSATGVDGPASSTFEFLVDKTAPVLPVNVGVASPFGALPNNTNTPIPTIFGQGEINSIVTILDSANSVVGTGLVGPNGAFSVALTKALPVGSNSLKITLTDVAGNISNPFSYSFNINPTAPTGPVAVSQISEDTGFSNTDGITRGLISTVTGSAPLGTRIRLVADAGTPAELNLTPTDSDLVAVNGSGIWTFTKLSGIPLAEGRHFLTATAIDAAGNVLSANPYRVIVDYTAPRDTLINSVSSSTGKNDLGATDLLEFMVGGRAEPFSRVTLSLGGTQLTDLITVSETGNWSYKIPAGAVTGNGIYQLKADTLDAAGNKSIVPAVLNVQVDQGKPNAPQIDGIKGSDGNFSTISGLSGMVIGGQAPAGSKVQVFLTPSGGSEQNLGLAITDPAGFWKLDNSQILRSSGDYIVRAQVIGNTGALSNLAELPVRIDTVAPTSPAISGFGTGVPTYGVSLIGTSAPLLVGSAEPRSKVELLAISENGKEVRATGVAGANGLWSIALAGLENAGITVTAQVRDAANNLSPASAPFQFRVDIAGPSIKVLTPGTGTGYNPNSWTGEFSGTAPDGGSGTQQVRLAIQGPNGLWFNGAGFNSASKIYVTAQGTNAWKLAFPASALQEGTTKFTVQATDNLGNSSESLEQTIAFSSTLPTVSSFNLVPGSKAGQFQGSLVFSSPVTGLTLAGFIATNGVVSDLSGTGTTYSFVLTAQKQGRITLSVAAGAAKDEFTNGNQASETLVRSYFPAAAFKVSGGEGTSSPTVRVVSPTGVSRDYQVFAPTFRGGVRSALTDYNGDGIADILAVPASGSSPLLRLINGSTGAVVRSIVPFAANYTAGLYVATGDVNGDGIEDVIVSTGGKGLGQVKVFSGKDFSVLSSFVPYSGFGGAITVAAADVTGDGKAEIITGTGAGVRADVRIFSGTGKFIQAVQAPAGAGTGGVFVAAADLNNDGFAEVLIGTGAGVPSEVRVNYLNAPSGQTPPAPKTIRPFATNFLGGARVGVADVNGDGVLDLVAGTGNGSSIARRYDGLTLKLIDEVFLEGNIKGGIFV